MTGSRIAAALWLGLAVASTGCGARDARDPPPSTADGSGALSGSSGTKPLVEIFSWWTAPGEAEALQALVDVHRASHPTSRLFNAAAASGAQAKETLHKRLARGDPPDLFQENAHDLLASLKENPGEVENIDEIFDELDLRRVVFPEIVDDVTIDGRIVAMPVNIHRENSLFYNKAIFAAHGLAPPTTFNELLEVCKALKRAGVTPIATADQGWILRIMFNSIAMGKMGSARYRDYFTGHGADAVPLLREAIVAFKDVLVNYTNADAAEDGFNWTNAAQAVYNGDAAMFLHGDWAKGYLVQLGWKPGVDFGVVGAPGAADLFLYGVDVFAIPKGAQNERGAREFLATIASTRGQVAFNRLKGSSPIRNDSPTDELDPLGRATLRDLQQARFRMLVPTRRAWDDAIGAFATTKNVDALLQAFIDNPPTP